MEASGSRYFGTGQLKVTPVLSIETGILHLGFWQELGRRDVPVSRELLLWNLEYNLPWES